MKGGFVAGDAQQYLEECVNDLPTLGRKKMVFPNDFLEVKAQLLILTIMLELIFPTA